jgi:hypothetical protein
MREKDRRGLKRGLRLGMVVLEELTFQSSSPTLWNLFNV